MMTPSCPMEADAAGSQHSILLERCAQASLSWVSLALAEGGPPSIPWCWTVPSVAPAVDGQTPSAVEAAPFFSLSPAPAAQHPRASRITKTPLSDPSIRPPPPRSMGMPPRKSELPGRTRAGAAWSVSRPRSAVTAAAAEPSERRRLAGTVRTSCNTV